MQAILADIHIVDLSSNPGLLKLRKGTTFVQKGSYKIVHVIDLHNFQLTLDQIDNVAKSLDKNEFQNVFQNKVFKLKNSFRKILPNKRVKRSWEGLGSAIKWVAGNADADDLRDINKKFEKVTELENALAKNSNQQIEINEIFQDRINELSNLISKSISEKFNQTFSSLDTINLMFNIDIVENKLESIAEAISLARLKVVDKNILGENETKLILEKFNEQNFTITSTSEMFTFLIPEIEYKDDDILYYHVSIPQVTPFERFYIEPLTRDKTEIKIEYNEILMNENSTFAINRQCLENSGKTLCQPEHIVDISDDQCIPQLLKTNPGNCIFKEVAGKFSVKSIGDGRILIKNAIKATKLTNTCGIADHVIKGTFYVSFSNCTVSINGETFENIEVKHREKFELLPSFEMTIRQRNIEPLIDLHDLHDLHIKNREKLRGIEENHKESETNIVATILLIVPIIIIVTVIIGATTYLVMINKINSIRRSNTLKGEELQDDPISPTAPQSHSYFLSK